MVLIRLWLWDGIMCLPKLRAEERNLNTGQPNRIHHAAIWIMIFFMTQLQNVRKRNEWLVRQCSGDGHVSRMTVWTGYNVRNSRLTSAADLWPNRCNHELKTKNVFKYSTCGFQRKIKIILLLQSKLVRPVNECQFRKKNTYDVRINIGTMWVRVRVWPRYTCSSSCTGQHHHAFPYSIAAHRMTRPHTGINFCPWLSLIIRLCYGWAAIVSFLSFCLQRAKIITQNMHLFWMRIALEIMASGIGESSKKRKPTPMPGVRCVVALIQICDVI